MSLKFSFGGSSPEPHDHDAPGITLPFAGAASRPTAGSSTLELTVTLGDGEVACTALSGDGVAYARAAKPVAAGAAPTLANAVRSVLARAGAELPEPLIESVTGVVLELGGAESAVLEELGLAVTPGATQLATVDEALQARTGVAAGTPIRAA